MKTFLWIIIALALIFGAYYYHKNSSKTQKPKPRAPKVTQPNKSNSGKGVRNWRPVKKVLDLSDQHTKDLQDTMK